MTGVFGSESLETHPLMADQLHPNAAREIALADGPALVIG